MIMLVLFYFSLGKREFFLTFRKILQVVYLVVEWHVWTVNEVTGSKRRLMTDMFGHPQQELFKMEILIALLLVSLPLILYRLTVAGYKK